MNTFFEKLTGGGAKPAPHAEEPYVITTRETTRTSSPMMNRKSSAQNPNPLKVQTEEEPMEEEVETPEPSPEEEGELTVDIYDRGDSIVIQSTVAGVRPEDLDISIASDTISIRGSREQAERVHDNAYYYKELFWGTFARTVILPEEVDDGAAEAMLKNGLLTVRLPKRKRGAVQKVKVKLT